MAKGWTIFTFGEVTADTRSTQKKRYDDRKFSKAIKNTKTLKYFELIEQSEKNEAAKIANENQLVQAYNEKKLQSKELIKQAQAVIKKREKKAEKAAAKNETEVVAAE